LVLFHGTRYQFRRFLGYYSDLMKNMSTSEKAGKANPKLGGKFL
jgi:hypothetical protein